MRPRSVLALLFPLLGTLLLLSSSSRPGLSADKPTPAELKDKVKTLVEQLADKDAGKQDEAAVELIQLGPDALPFLPKPNVKLSASQKTALAQIRKKLRDQQIQRDLAPKLVTIDAELTLSQALTELEKQTGIKVEDRRESDDPKMKLKLNKVTFWQALDVIARESDAVVNYYQGSKGLGLEKRPEGYVNPPVAYDGIFRATVRRITAQRRLDLENSNYLADVEIAWEPRFRPFRLDLVPDEFTIQDDKSRKVALPDNGRGGDEPRKDSRAVSSRYYVLFDVPLGSLDRSSAKLGLLKLPIKFVGPTRMQTFAFDKSLAEIKKDPKTGEMTQEGVTVKVSNLELAKDHWTALMSLEYPADGPQFESFESWLIFNEMSLKNDKGDTFPNNGGYVIEGTAGNRASVSYHFIDSKKDKLTRGEPSDWKPVYKVPGLIVEVSASFEFKDVPTPRRSGRAPCTPASSRSARRASICPFLSQ